MCATGRAQRHPRNVTHTRAPLHGCQRILVLGSGGSGKSTLARQLGDRLGLPVIHLDIHYWSHGWKPTPEADWHARVQRLVQGQRWVMDGNFSGSLALRLARCDAAVFLDLSRWVCVRSVFARWLRYRFAQRPDLPEGCPEQIDPEFLSWVWNFPPNKRVAYRASKSMPETDCRATLMYGLSRVVRVPLCGSVTGRRGPIRSQ